LPERTLIQGGRLITLDPASEGLGEGDVLIADGVIAEVAPTIEAGDCQVIDASGSIVMPGFVDTHRHTWQTAMRGICADWTLLDYFRGIRLHIAQAYEPDDMYAGNLAGALEALDAGVTTILDFSHCNNTREHAEQALAGLRDSGIRATFAYGFYPVPLAAPGFRVHSERVEHAREMRAAHFADEGARVAMGLALTELGLAPFAHPRAVVERAGELDVLLSAHIGTVRSPNWPQEIELLHEAGLLGPRQVHVHCNACSDVALGLIADSGAAVSVTPETEMQMGMGMPITGRALAHGLRPSLGCDIASNNSGDLLTQARLALQTQRALDNEPKLIADEMPEAVSLTARDALEMATINGAEAMGLGSVIGSLSPGKEADVLLVSTERLGMAPVIDPVAAVILQAQPADIRTVLVGGEVVKRDGELLGAATKARQLVLGSGERLQQRMADRGGLLLEMPPGWFEVTEQAVLANLRA
jgi:cytosine/adenosine deaminase-related metal-dependent hydrolase